MLIHFVQKVVSKWQPEKLFFRAGNSVIRALLCTIRCIAGVVQKFTFFMAGWAFVGVGVGIKGIPTI